MTHCPDNFPDLVFVPAPVRPRVRLAPAGDPLPLEYHVRRLLDARSSGILNVYGPPGSGKSMALAHLAVTFHDPRLLLIDDAAPDSLFDPPPGRLVVATSPGRSEKAFLSLELVPRRPPRCRLHRRPGPSLRPLRRHPSRPRPLSSAHLFIAPHPAACASPYPPPFPSLQKTSSRPA